MTVSLRHVPGSSGPLGSTTTAECGLCGWVFEAITTPGDDYIRPAVVAHEQECSGSSTGVVVAMAVVDQAKPRVSRSRKGVPAVEASVSSTSAVDALAAVPTVPAASAESGLELMWVDPRDLVLDSNVRRDPRVGADFVASLRENGVRVPLLARRDVLGHLLVVDGQRRLHGALRAELQQVPVMVVDGIGDEESRIVTQVTVNEQRAGLTTAERIGAVEQLALFGRSPAAIAKRTGLDEKEAAAAVALAAVPKAAEAVLSAAPEIDLVSAAAIAEFADDKAEQDRLLRTAKTEPGRLAGDIEAVRQRRQERAVLAARVAELEEHGLTATTLDYYQHKSPLEKAKKLEHLVDRTEPGPKGGKPKLVPIDPVAHVGCPGHVVHVDVRRGEVVETPWCTSWRKLHIDKFKSDGPLTPGPSAEERRRVVENNKKSDVAVVVRRKWIIEELLQRKKLPTDAVAYAAVIHDAADRAGLGIRDYQARTIWEEIAPWARGQSRQLSRSRLTAAARPDLYWLVVGLVLGERSLHERDWWRQSFAQDAKIGHLTTLKAWGYELSDLEQEWLTVAVEAAAKKAPAGGDDDVE